MEITNKELAEKMILYRAKHNLTVNQFAEQTGLTAQTIRMIECGHQNPSRVNRVKLWLIVKDV